MNKSWVGAGLLVVAGALAGCGMEAAGTAATGAVIKQQELQQGQAAQEAIESQLRQTLQQGADRLQQMEQDAAGDER